MPAEVVGPLQPPVDPGTDQGQPDSALKLQVVDAARQSAQSDTASQQLQRILELQEQNLKLQTELLERAKTQDQHAKFQAQQPPKVDPTEFWKSIAMTVSVGLFYDGSPGSGWFLCFLKAVFAAEPSLFESDAAKTNFALSKFSPDRMKAYRDYRRWPKDTGDSWAKVEAYLKGQP